MILEPPVSVQKLQAALQAKAKEAADYRFYLLYDKLYRKDVLEYAYRCCKANGGAPGVDSQDFADIEAVLAEMRHIDDSMSTYKPTSEVSQVNDKAANGPMHISKELFDLLTTAKEYSVITEGAFDITYASVGYLYDFRKHQHPDEEQIAKALPAIDYRHVILDPKDQTVYFSQKGVRIDLGGIAKGYSVDRGIDVLKSLGYTRAYVGAGGDSRIIGDRFGKPWVVGIRDPTKAAGNVIARIPLVDAAISTSGYYERFFEEKGVRYHHIIDPHTDRK